METVESDANFTIYNVFHQCFDTPSFRIPLCFYIVPFWHSFVRLVPRNVLCLFNIYVLRVMDVIRKSYDEAGYKTITGMID